ncbi:MAG: hypothetical protein A2Z14_07865 [Chloroflexi bacterium RBG_16_48_8]|nr:MAG: hypothetical protein A2Z14_07865 [Chloroflexi bacterium RBG_16_48_8]
MKFHEFVESFCGWLLGPFPMKKWHNIILIAFGLAALILYLIVNLWGLSSDFMPIMTSCQAAPQWIFVLTTLLLLAGLSSGSVLTWRWSQHRAVHSHLTSWLAAAFIYNATAVYPLLVLWFHLLLTIVLEVMLPPLELWFVAMALSWMTTPFATLGVMHIGARLGSWLDRKG